MILYYSGTGNSAHAAKKIAGQIGDQACNLFYKIKAKDTTPLHSDKAWIIVSPTYCWRLPHLLEDLLAAVDLTGSRDIYFVLTCGNDIGNAGAHARRLVQKKGMTYKGTAGLVMPENYLALFATPDAETADRIIREADRKLVRLGERIKAGEDIEKQHITLLDRLKSGPVNKAFYFFFVKAKKFRVTDACVSCGLCEQVCPCNNIMLVLGRPVWGKACTHCMACIARCPAKAIEYGKKTETRNRYLFPEKERDPWNL